MKREFPVRKPTRSKYIDYAKTGAYFVTICTQDRKHLLSRIAISDNTGTVASYSNERDCISCLNEVQFMTKDTGAASYSPTFLDGIDSNSKILCLSSIGKIAEEQLFALEERFPDIHIDEYIFMPNHIHAIIFINENGTALSSSKKLTDVLRVYKSLTSGICKKMYKIDKLFQRSYYDHVIRDKKDYDNIVRYIRENPIRWCYDELYSDF